MARRASAWLRSKGSITRTEWTIASAVKLAGCVADARVTGMTVCIKDNTGKDAMLTTASGTFSKEMKVMIANLPDGTPLW